MWCMVIMIMNTAAKRVDYSPLVSSWPYGVGPSKCGSPDYIFLKTDVRLDDSCNVEYAYVNGYGTRDKSTR